MPDDTTPNNIAPAQRVFKTPDKTSVTSLVAGVPIATVVVWLVSNFWLPKGVTLDPTAATAIGSVGAVIFGEVWGTISRLLSHISPDPGPGPADGK